MTRIKIQYTKSLNNLSKKTLLIITLLALSTIFTACGKIPFEKQKPMSSAALVYVYLSMDSGINDTNRMPNYVVGINGKNTEGSIEYGTYKYFNLKPGQITISATRSDIEKQDIKLNLDAGKIYYLRIQSFSDDFAKFEIKQVNSNEAYAELKDTTLADKFERSQNMISELISSSSDEPEVLKEGAIESTLTQSISKMDEIQKAYDMKTKGMLSEDEFKAIKAEILAK